MGSTADIMPIGPPTRKRPMISTGNVVEATQTTVPHTKMKQLSDIDILSKQDSPLGGVSS